MSETNKTASPIHLRTPLPGPKAAAIIARDNKRVSPSYTRDYPFVMAKGHGAVVEDVDGDGRPEIERAVRERNNRAVPDERAPGQREQGEVASRWSRGA